MFRASEEDMDTLGDSMVSLKALVVGVVIFNISSIVLLMLLLLLVGCNAPTSSSAATISPLAVANVTSGQDVLPAAQQELSNDSKPTVIVSFD